MLRNGAVLQAVKCWLESRESFFSEQNFSPRIAERYNRFRPSPFSVRATSTLIILLYSNDALAPLAFYRECVHTKNTFAIAHDYDEITPFVLFQRFFHEFAFRLTIDRYRIGHRWRSQRDILTRITTLHFEHRIQDICCWWGLIKFLLHNWQTVFSESYRWSFISNVNAVSTLYILFMLYAFLLVVSFMSFY